MKVEFYEYGKYFTSEGASDFCVLAYSNKKYIDKDSDIKPQEMYERLYFQENTNFSKQKGSVSVAFISTYPQTWSLFHIQRRREDERLDLQEGQFDITGRSYYQIRCCFMGSKELVSDHQAGMSPLVGSVFGSEKPLSYTPNLADYREKEIYYPPLEVLCTTTESTSFLYELIKSQPKYNNTLLSIAKTIFSVAKTIVEFDKLQTVFVVCHNKLTLSQRLRFAEDVERLVYWKKRRWISFALDIVVAPSNGIKLQFCNDPEEIPVAINDVTNKFFDLDSEVEFNEKNLVLNKVLQSIINLNSPLQRKWERFNDLFFNQLPLISDLDIIFISDSTEKILHLLNSSKDILNLDEQDGNEAIVNCISNYCLELTKPQRKSLVRELRILVSNNAFATESVFKMYFESFFRGYILSAPEDYDFNADFVFLKSLIPLLTKDKALGYLVNRDIDRTPIDSYWSAALNIVSDDKKALDLFCVIINSCFEDNNMLFGLTYFDVERLDSLAKLNQGARKLLNRLINDLLQFPFAEFDLAINFPKKILEKMNDEQSVPSLLVHILSDPSWANYRDTCFRQALGSNDVHNLIGNLRKSNLDEEEYKIVFSWIEYPSNDEREQKILEFLKELKEISRVNKPSFYGHFDSYDKMLKKMMREFVSFLQEPARKKNSVFLLEEAMQELEGEVLKILQKNDLGISPLGLLDSLCYFLEQITENASVFDKVRALKFLVPYMYRISESKAYSMQRKNKLFFRTNPQREFLYWLIDDFFPRFVAELKADFMHSEETLILTNEDNGRFDRALKLNMEDLDQRNAKVSDNISLWLVYSYAKLHNWDIHPDLERKCQSNKSINPFMNTKKIFWLWKDLLNWLYNLNLL